MKRRLTKKLAKRSAALPRRPVSDFEAEYGPLSPEERAMLSDPTDLTMTEDEDDAIVCQRRRDEALIPFADMLRAFGYKLVPRRARGRRYRERLPRPRLVRSARLRREWLREHPEDEAL